MILILGPFQLANQRAAEKVTMANLIARYILKISHIKLTAVTASVKMSQINLLV